MITRSLNTALIFATAFGALAALPLAAARADTMAPTTNHAAVTQKSTGVYDFTDHYRDAMGNPLPGWQQLVYGGGEG
jgi:hypothetical protein